jgi:hypothetical protein
MTCDECLRLERLFLESMVSTDRGETALRCYLLTHIGHAAGVSDLDEYDSLRIDRDKSAAERHQAYLKLVEHRKSHS